MMALVLADCVDHGFLHGGTYLGIVQKLDVLHPGNAEENPEAVFQAEIEEPTRRSGVNTDQVNPCVSDGGKITGHLLFCTKLVSFGIRCEGGVGDSFDKKLFFSLEEKL